MNPATPEQLKGIDGMESITHESVRLILKKNECKPSLKKMWCIATITPQYKERMYRLLDLYEQSGSCKYPIVCMDEKSKQLLTTARDTLPLKPGSKEKYDYEYKRNGTRNIFVAVEPFGGKRISLVLDNLNTHFESSFYQTFSKEEAERILRRIEFYYTPKQASWLNMAKIEINRLDRECLARRIGEYDILETEIRAWEKQRNTVLKKLCWSFTRQDADRKLSKQYVA